LVCPQRGRRAVKVGMAAVASRHENLSGTSPARAPSVADPPAPRGSGKHHLWAGYCDPWRSRQGCFCRQAMIVRPRECKRTRIKEEFLKIWFRLGEPFCRAPGVRGTEGKNHFRGESLHQSADPVSTLHQEGYFLRTSNMERKDSLMMAHGRRAVLFYS